MRPFAPAIARHAGNLFRPLRLVVAAEALMAVLLLGGCSVDRFQTPQFDTTVSIPLGTRTTTGLDLIEEDGYIEGDSTGASPLRYVLRGSLDQVDAGPLLEVTLPATNAFFGLQDVRVESDRLESITIPLRDLSGQFSHSSPEPQNVAVSPFTVERVTRVLPPPESFAWVRLHHGALHVTLHNRLPVPLGDGVGGSGPMWIRFRDATTGTVISAGEMDGPIAPGESAVTTASLDGVELSQNLEVEVGGSSPGSGGVPVEVRVDEQAVDLELSLDGLAADSVLASVPAQAADWNGAIALANDMDVTEGVLRDGLLRIEVENPYPVSGQARVTFPTVFLASAPDTGLSATLPIPPSYNGVPGHATAVLALAGWTVRPTSAAAGTLEYAVRLETNRSASPVRIGTRASAHVRLDETRIRFDAVTARLFGRHFAVPPTETALDPPEGMDELSFTNASLILEVSSTIAFDSQADLTLIGDPGNGGSPVSLPLRFPIEKANDGVPRVTRVTFDETNSAILDLIAVHPRKLRVTGDILVGAGEEGTIRRTDWVRGDYTVAAPLRMRIGRVTHRTDPTRFAIPSDERERIRENLLGATARGTVRNHLPAGMDVRLVFADSEADLALDPVAHPDRVLALHPVAVAPGEIDPATGRVISTRESPFEIAIGPDEVAFFDRDSLSMQAVLVLSEADTLQTVELTALDYVQVDAMLQFRMQVKP